ncbi:MAG: T9SS type A sorting domain-containing protein, partial [Candidatus Latescibacteria bacterium]|nr:T9SS type A sorting domain-containing protein [Candidatus Latescibacterota bacterium]
PTDLDGDGDIDLAVANAYSDNVSILLGNGDGTFTSAVNYGAGGAPQAVAVADLDGDGGLDLAVVNATSNNVSVLLGNGDGTFGSAVNYGTGVDPRSVAPTDLDGDGDIDLAVANAYSDNVSILLGNGDGTFTSAVNYAVGNEPQFVAAADLDGDGDNDLAVPNYNSYKVSILLNLSNRPPLPIISSITDIPNDQGRQVTLTWNRCGPDRPGSSATITEYAVYRKIDNSLSSGNNLFNNVDEGELMVDSRDRNIFSYPPGDWHYLLSVPARAEQEYSVVVSTLADSTISEGMYYSTFFVSALTATPGVYYDSEPDSGYSVDNLEPGVPGAFMVAYNTGSGNELTWEECEDEDFMCFNIYRSAESGFEPGEENLVHSTIDIQWTDTADECWKYHYKISSLDFSGNESEPKGPDEITGIEMPDVPTAFALHQNYPNPFNPLTTIQFDLPVGSKVNLSIYDVNGKRVTVLLDREMTAGCKSVSWNGRSSSGETVASGVYFYRISADKFVETKKMILMR